MGSESHCLVVIQHTFFGSPSTASPCRPEQADCVYLAMMKIEAKPAWVFMLSSPGLL